MEWNLQIHCLQLQSNYMPKDHTGEQMQDALSMALDEWNLVFSKLVAIKLIQIMDMVKPHHR